MPGRPWRTYLQSVNGYFMSRYARYSSWNVTVNALHLYALGRTEFFLISDAFSASFHCELRMHGDLPKSQTGLSYTKWYSTIILANWPFFRRAPAASFAIVLPSKNVQKPFLSVCLYPNSSLTGLCIPNFSSIRPRSRVKLCIDRSVSQTPFVVIKLYG